MTKKKNLAKAPSVPTATLPFVEHFKELRRRLTIIAVSIGVFATGAYFIQHQIVSLLLAPAHGQKLIYTTPGGGLDFLFRVCIYTGIVFSLPVIIYHVLKYLEPVVGNKSFRFALFGSSVSAILAVAGMAFGYFAGLPAALHFLFHQFSPASEIQPLIAAPSYLKFVALYMFGAALLFQIPLVLVTINRIRKLKPRSLFKAERWVILGSFVLAVLMNPTPSVIDQVLLAGPMILMYQVGIGMIAFINRPRRSRKGRKDVGSLLDRDAAIRAERLARLQDARLVWEQASCVAEQPVASSLAIVTMPDYEPVAVKPAKTEPVAKPVHPAHSPAARPRQYVDGLSGARKPIKL